ncbi:hypothetical protein SLEP1_g44138 [Rubroshorea leprosula]|uniref:Uncharacterized protein n=1 Tax=Rubroshorea leprosula TaxID=152421 RepID=A0AAV5LFX7_9ROSI|nr:hypothetical protein SLEP1_g44138 [Rubroshorea leprosula]
MVSKLILFSKFQALCTCGTRLTSARRLSRLGFGFWGVTLLIANRSLLFRPSFLLFLIFH